MRKVITKSWFWILASIISACIGIILIAVSFELPDKNLLETLVSLMSLLFLLLALIFGVVVCVSIIVQIFKNPKPKTWFLAIIKLVTFATACCLLVILLAIPVLLKAKLRNSYAISGLDKIVVIGDSLIKYSNQNGSLPDANNWCDLLIGFDSEINKEFFHITGQRSQIKCTFAFNKDLTNLSLDNINGNVVLLFEADGKLNLSGGPELLDKGRHKDRYFSLKKQIFVYVMFIDGTVAKYRLHDGAVSLFLFKPVKNEPPSYWAYHVNDFSNWYKKGQTPYSPLRWK